MKKLLLFAFAVAAIAACNRRVDVVTPGNGGQQETDSDVIRLVSGSGGVAMTMADVDPTANVGVRKFFILGDQIALYAAYVKDEGGTKGPDWGYHSDSYKTDSVNQVGAYFKNTPACCTKAGTVTDSPAEVTAALFGWGAAGTGGVGVDQTYPRNGKSLYIYGYYPYSSADTLEMDPAKGPQLNVELATLAEITGDTPHAQPDILFTKGYSQKKSGEPALPLDTVSRNNQLDSLVFKHALAQVNFVVNRLDGAASCKLRKVEFSAPKKGILTIMDGTIEVTDPAEESEWVNYVIKDQLDQPVPFDSESKLYVLENNPLMILPLTVEEAKECKLKLTVYYGSNPDPSEDVINEKTFIVNLNIDAMKAFQQGKKNTLTMQLSETGVALKASIEPWVDNVDGDNPVIPVE